MSFLNHEENMKSFLQQTLASKHLSKFALSLSLGALVACGGGVQHPPPTGLIV